jgi:squalene synthase HpnC
VSLADAYAACERLARTHYENFPVASRLLPSRMRPHLAAVYAFARTADDFADEDGFTEEERHRLLDYWLDRLRAETIGQAWTGGGPPFVREGVPTAGEAALTFEALGHSIRTLRLPGSLFEDLLSAFRQDVTKRRYVSWAELLDYCRRSANPVGRLVLRIGGWQDERLDRASDALCTALQLTNFWQDLAVDWRRGRLYVPLAERDAAAADDRSLDARDMSPEWRRALLACTERTRDLFARGRPVCDGVTGRLRWELRATWLGGVRILDRLEASQFDVFRARPTLGLADVPQLGWQTVTWRAVQS